MTRPRNFRYAALAGAILMAAGVFSPVHAQDPDDMQRGVARISMMNGEVLVRRGDSGDWVAGIINAPLLSDDRISTLPNSRVEVEFDSANILRIGGNAEVRLTQLEEGHFQLAIAHGSVTYRILRPGATVEADTPTVSVRPSKQGTYRISVSESGETEVIARSGDVEVFTPHGSQWVAMGQMMMARGNPADPEFQIVAAPGPDDWDRWNESRDRLILQSQSYQYVGPGVYGAEDLDNNGTWTDVPTYGPVWHPTGVAADWAPYQAGRWAWEDWYGWTWVSYDPWGWAPYHYGRWFNQPGIGWCWYPGLRTARHYWAPALVGFFGFGHTGVGFGFGFGNIGWVPLAPFEVFHPWWGRNFYGRAVFERSINVTNVNITNVYRNARVANGVSGISAENFRNGRFGNGNVMRVSGNQIREAGMIHGQVPISPTSANLHYSNRTVTNAPRSNDNARFFTHQQPNPVQRVPFNRTGSTQPGMSQPSSNRSGVAGGGLPQTNPRAQQSAGWRRFGEPSGQGGVNPGVNSRPESNSFRGSSTPSVNRFENTRPPAASEPPANRGGGWNRFGQPGTAGRQASPGNSAPRQSSPNYSAPRYSETPQRQNTPAYNAPRNYNPPAQRQSAPNYSAPRYSETPQRQNTPAYNAPRNYNPPAQRQSAPRSAPSYSAPRSGGGGGGAGGNRGGSGGSSNHSGGNGGGNHGRH